MDPVSRLNQTLGVLSSQLKELRLKKTETSAAPVRAKKKGTSGTPPKCSVDELRQQIIDRIGAIDPADRNMTNVGRVFVRSVLAWEFGEALLQDPQFDGLCRDVESTLNSDPLAKDKFHASLRQLFGMDQVSE